MATIQVRNLGTNWDPQRGQGAANFLTDLQAVSQIVESRLRLFEGEWFEDTTTGLPLFQRILGVASTSQAVAQLIRQQIIATPYVTEIQNSVAQYDSASRAYSYSATVQTAFGALSVTLQPGSGAVVTTVQN